MLALSALSILEKNKISSTGAWLILLTVTLPNSTIIRIVRNNEDVTYQGELYVAFDFALEAVVHDIKGKLPSVNLKVSNVGRVFQSYIEELEGIVGSTVLIQIVNSALLAEDFSELDLTFEIQKTSADSKYVTFELGVPSPLYKRFPLYRYSGAICNWASRFKGAECLLPDQKVLMEFGYTKEIQDVRIGDRVVCGNGKIGTVSFVSRRRVSEDVCEIKVKNMPCSLKITKEHPVLFLSGRDAKCSKNLISNKHHRVLKGEGICHLCGRKIKKADFVSASSVAPGGYLVSTTSFDKEDMEVISVPRILRSFNKPYRLEEGKVVPYKKIYRDPHVPEFIPLNDSLLRLLGYYLAEGSSAGYVVSFAFHEKEKEYHDDVIANLRKYFNIEPRKTVKKGQHCVEITFRSSIAASVFEYLGGVRSFGKKICPEVMLLPPEKQYNVLVGYFRGDGFLRMMDGSIHGAAASGIGKALMWQIWTILLRNRIISRFSSFNMTHEIIINGKEGCKLSNDIFHKNSSFKIKDLKDMYLIGNQLYLPVREVNSFFYEGDVFNLTIEGQDETYIVGGLIVHNCKFVGAATTCDGRLSTCESHNNVINYGGFAGLGQGGIRFA